MAPVVHDTGVGRVIQVVGLLCCATAPDDITGAGRTKRRNGLLLTLLLLLYIT